MTFYALIASLMLNCALVFVIGALAERVDE